ncbi:hypothetical protein GCM10022381_25280 [Leifsonia kafniensis]|uniref:Uncharacterized protein n=1 Tax=Leifsonia kafniensis TaxID=475957 RepID=A0ABP7KPG5_9MICO
MTPVPSLHKLQMSKCSINDEEVVLNSCTAVIEGFGIHGQQIAAALAEVGAARGDTGIGGISEDGQSRVNASFLRQTAGVRADDAARKSWLTTDRSAVMAHIERMPS